LISPFRSSYPILHPTPFVFSAPCVWRVFCVVVGVNVCWLFVFWF
jgi:hypothetical protein